MSVLLMQVGQCGNQIGCKIFNNMIEEMKNSSECLAQLIADSYFTIDSKDKIYANSLLIDMEAKVIEKCMKNAKERGWNYYDENIINKQSGSGNNWANGFFNHGPSVENVLLEKLSAFSEKFDYIDCIILINSLAGGTGSGLGSYVNIVIKDFMPTVNLFNVSIFPHKAGEVIVNSYNTLLSLSESYKVSDLMTIIHNQEMFDICREIHKIKKIGFDNLNQVISKQLMSTLLPTLGKSMNSKIKPYVRKSFLSEIIEFLGLDPRLKFARIISTPEMPEEHIAYTNNNWLSLMKRGYHMLINRSNESKIDWTDKQTVKIHSMMPIYRGKNLEEISELNESDSGYSLSRDNNNSNPFQTLLKTNPNISYREAYDINEINKYEKHLTVLNNSSFICEDLNATLHKAGEMYEHNAFIHQYEKYGMEKSDFLDAFAFCEQINFDYNNLIN